MPIIYLISQFELLDFTIGVIKLQDFLLTRFHILRNWTPQFAVIKPRTKPKTKGGIFVISQLLFVIRYLEILLKAVCV